MHLPRRHVAALGAYSAGHAFARPALEAAAANETPKGRYRIRRLMEALEYGSGSDYML